MASKDKTEALIHLNAQLVKQNKAFTQALKNQRPHVELVEIYTQVKVIYNEIRQYKQVQQMAG